MVTAKKSTKPKSTKLKAELKAPYLDYLIFTKCSSERMVAENGMPSPFTSKGSFLELTSSSSCSAVENKHDQSSRAAISLGLMAKAMSGKDETVFYSGEVRAVGFFICDPAMTPEEIQNESTKDSSYFAGAFDVVYAIASRELERQIELTGIPAPPIPMSQNLGANDFSRKKPKSQ